MRQGRLLGLVLLLAVPLAVIEPQGKGQGQGQAQGKTRGNAKQSNAAATKRASAKVERAQPRAARARSEVAGMNKSAKSATAPKSATANNAKARSSSPRVEEVGGEVARPFNRDLVRSAKHGERMAARAIARATRNGAPENSFVLTPLSNRVRVLNRSGAVLLDLDNDRDIGEWKVVGEPDRAKSGAPSFCRSGAGHPVWGRQWCVDKGFGLGQQGNIRWTRVVDPRSILIRQPVTTGVLARDVLLDVLGDIVFNRLAAQAITLGYVEPLSGRWIGEPGAGPKVLLLSAADRPVAEMVDVNRDGWVDMLVVAARQ